MHQPENDRTLITCLHYGRRNQEQAGMFDEDMFDNEGVTEMLSRRNGRFLKASMKTCSTTITSSGTSEMTVLFVPAFPTASVSKLSKHQLFLSLEALALGLIKESRVNSPNNSIPVDAYNTPAVNQIFSSFPMSSRSSLLFTTRQARHGRSYMRCECCHRISYLSYSSQHPLSRCATIGHVH